MRTLLLTLVTVALSAAVYAQPPGMFVQNFTNCDFLVTFAASPGGCGFACASVPVCVPAGGIVPIAPCGPATWVWEIANVVPTTPGCGAFCPPGTNVIVSPPAAGCAAPIAANAHCFCGGAGYTADFTVLPGGLAIY